MRALQVERLQRRRDLADGCKGLSSGSPLPMEFHSSSICESYLLTFCSHSIRYLSINMSKILILIIIINPAFAEI